MHNTDTLKKIYNKDFFSHVDRTSEQSSAVIVPLVMDLINPASVIDIGCGTGCWLLEFKKNGVKQVLGIDAFVEDDQRHIEADEYVAMNLLQFEGIPGHFDLAVCLEVLEHLPARAAHHIVKEITEKCQSCLFSAAVPGQGGTNHINEQWHTYWHTKFAEHGWIKYDVIRPQILLRKDVAPWYRQNTFIYARPGHCMAPKLDRLHNDYYLDMEVYYPRITNQMQSIRGAFALLKRAIKHRLFN